MPSLTKKSLNKAKSFRRSIKRRNSLQPHRTVNAEKIGEGGFGVVSRPPAECAPELGLYRNNNGTLKSRSMTSITKNRRNARKKYIGNPNYISKLGEGYQIEKELEIGRIVKRYIDNWDDYFCFTEFVCDAPEDKHIRVGMNDYQDTYGIAPYCGITLDSILQGKYHIAPIETCCLMESLKQLAIGLGELHRLEIYHQDIHDENVLFNPKDNKLRWIDFGLAEDLDEVRKNAGNNYNISPILTKAKVEDTEALIFNIIKPTLEFIRYKLRQIPKAKKTIKSEACEDDVTYYLHLMPKKMEEIFLPNRYNEPDKYFAKVYKIKEQYNKFVNLFIGDYDENKKCSWITKNNL